MPILDLILGLPWPVLLLSGCVLLYYGAEWLVDGAVALARRLGVSTLVIGLTIVAAGTSAPELAVNVISALGGNTGLSFGNVVGSNIANIGLVIGVGALAAPIAVHGQVLRRELPLLLLVSGATLALPWLPGGRVDGGRGFTRLDGVLLFLAFLAFLGLWYVVGRRAAQDPLTAEASERAGAVAELRAAPATALVVIGTLALFAGGYLTREGAVAAASAMNLSEALIGLTVVAVVTSLPELFTVWVAARKRQADLAVGNVVGSNVFNLLLVLGVTSIVQDVPVPDHGLQDLLVMIGFTGLLWLVCIIPATANRVSRLEGSGLLALYIAAMAWSVLRERL